MKKYLSLILVVVLLHSCTTNTTEPTPVDVDPTGYYKIDVKTTFFNKYTATGVKNGLIGYMRVNGSKWCIDKEVGEDYSFWINNVRSSNTGDSSIVTFDLELRTAAFVTDGDSIEARHGYRVAYPNSPDWSQEGQADAVKVSEYIKSTLERNVAITKSAATFAASISGNPEIKSVIDFMLKNFFSDTKIQQSQVEGAMVGLIAFAEMRSMVKKNIEKKV